MAKSYFAILGISPKASGDEIRSAFRRLAKEFHPDHYTGSSKRFRDIEDHPADLGEVSPVRSFQSFTPSFDEVFDWLWSNFSDLTAPKSGRVENLTLEVILTPEQARQGGNAQIMVPAQAACPTCRGHGGVEFYECMRCAGEGTISGEAPVSVSFPPGLTKDHAVLIPLDRFGIRNLHLTVLFRPTG